MSTKTEAEQAAEPLTPEEWARELNRREFPGDPDGFNGLARDVIRDAMAQARAEQAARIAELEAAEAKAEAFKSASAEAYSRITQAQLDAGMTERVGSGVGDAADRLVAFTAGPRAELEAAQREAAEAQAALKALDRSGFIVGDTTALDALLAAERSKREEVEGLVRALQVGAAGAGRFDGPFSWNQEAIDVWTVRDSRGFLVCELRDGETPPALAALLNARLSDEGGS